MKDNNSSTPILREVSMLRPLLIIGVIIGHCFCVYNGANNSWPNSMGVESILIYKYLNPFFISLGTFVMIMGYLFAYKKEKYLNEGNWNFIKKKFIRLYVPCIFFSLIYAWMFIWKQPTDLSVKNIVKLFVFGAGHMWFLPMAFYNYCILKICQPIIDKFPLLTLILGIVISPLMTRVPDQIFTYFPFIIFGYLIYGHINIVKKYSIILLILWLLIFVFRCYVSEVVSHSKVQFIMRFLSNTVSAFALISFASRLGNLFSAKTYYSFEILGVCAMGTYLLQEFIVRFLVYKSPLFSWTGSYLFPWITAIIAIPLSFGLSHIICKSKAGKILMG